MSDDGTLFALLGVALLAGAGAIARTRSSAPEPWAPPPLSEGSAMVTVPGDRPGELTVVGFYDPKERLLETVPGITPQGQAELAALFQPRRRRQIGYDDSTTWEW